MRLFHLFTRPVWTVGKANFPTPAPAITTTILSNEKALVSSRLFFREWFICKLLDFESFTLTIREYFGVVFSHAGV